MKWFQHEAAANRDPKIEKLLMRYGADGYALYFFCLELIAAPIDSKHINFELEHDAEYLSHRLHIDTRRVEEIMRFLLEQELFEVDEITRRITCLQLALRLENSIIKNPELKKAQKKMAAKIARHKAKKNSPSRKIPDFFGKVRTDIDLYADEHKKNAVSLEAPQKARTPKYIPGDETREIDNAFLAEVRAQESGE